MSEHSPVGGSGAYRWLMCPGSVRMCEGLESEDSAYSLEGTAAHNLAEECILSQRSPYSYINGGTMTVEKDDGEQIEIEVTADMASAVMTYIQHVMRICHSRGSRPLIEEQFHMDWIDPELWGRNDFSTFVPFDTAFIYDYKHGAGVVVEVQYDEIKTYFCGGRSDKNPQLMYYALGALGPANEHFIQDLEIGIVQPRAQHHSGVIRNIRVSIEELYKWRDEILIPGLEATRDPEAPCVGGEWCRFCDAIGTCPAVFDKVKAVTRQSADEVFAPKKIQFPAYADMTSEQKVAFVEYKGMLEKWMKSIKAEIDKEVLAGKDVPGLKPVLGNRKRDWLDPVAAAAAARDALGSDAYTEPKLKTVPQMEKELAAHGLPKDKLEAHVSETRGTVVVLESDKRPAVTVENAADVFGTGGIDSTRT